MITKYPNASLVKLEKAVESFAARIDELFGNYADTILGFRATLLELNRAQMKMKNESPGADFDSQPVSFGWGHWQNPSHRIAHQTTVQDLRRRNSDNGCNIVHAAQFFVVLLFSFCEEEHRPAIGEALGIKRGEAKKCKECKRRLPDSKGVLQVPILGDVRLLRIDIVHHRGILQLDTFRKLEVLHLKKGVDLAALPYFRGLIPGREIRLLPPDVIVLCSRVKAALDDIVVDAGGIDPKYRRLKQVKIGS